MLSLLPPLARLTLGLVLSRLRLLVLRLPWLRVGGVVLLFPLSVTGLLRPILLVLSLALTLLSRLV